MPHQCANCGRTFPDGSKEMLSGCPECGGNKFQFRPAGANTPPVEPESRSSTGQNGDAAAKPATASATKTGGEPSTAEQTEPSAEPATANADEAEAAADETAHGTAEDTAQAAARSGMVSPDELEANASAPPEPDEAEQPGLAELREELNEQFESIKIVEPGQYELNLMGLYDREEYIIALEENGRYVINVPDSWQD